MDFSDNFTDEFSDKQECIVFDSDEIALSPRRGRVPIPWRILIWLTCGLVIGALWICKSGGAFDGDKDGLGMNGVQGNGQIGQTVSKEEETLTEGSDDFLGIESEDNMSDSDTETEIQPNPEDGDDGEDAARVYSADLSFSELGDGYFYNYSGKSPDTEGLLEIGFSGGRDYYTEHPVVLIIHSHIREAYLDCNPNDPTDALSKSVIGVGETVARELNRRGVPTVHCTVIHGYGDGNAYVDAEETIAEMLRVYPTIEYVIDLRRLEEKDAEGRILKTESANGFAQIRVTVSGRSELWQDNLALALALRKKLNSDGSKFCLPVVFTDVSLNAKSSPYYLKVDVGASGNTAGEAITAGEYFAVALSEILKNK